MRQQQQKTPREESFKTLIKNQQSSIENEEKKTRRIDSFFLWDGGKNQYIVRIQEITKIYVDASKEIRKILQMSIRSRVQNKTRLEPPSRRHKSQVW